MFKIGLSVFQKIYLFEILRSDFFLQFNRKFDF
jgi:hypothetical protein